MEQLKNLNSILKYFASKMWLYIIQLVFISVIPSLHICESARILAAIPTPSFSHQVVFRPIWNELARRGHDVIVITTDPQNDPSLNITEIDVSFTYDLWKSKNVMKNFNEMQNNIIEQQSMIGEVMTDIVHQELLHPEVQILLQNKSEHFDLVIVEFLHPLILGLSERFKAPYIGVISVDLPNEFHSILGNPTHSVIYPNFLYLGYEGKLNFWQRLKSVAVTFVIRFGFVVQFLKRGSTDKKVMQEHFGKDVPSFLDIMQNVSMVLINENPAFNIRPLGPAFVLFGGGAHLMPLKPLPQDLKNYLDGAKDGCIYFSLGTNVKSDIFGPDKRKIVLDVFRQLPYRVLWKFDVTDIPDVPENVKISNWLPQQDVLRHPNIKAFITQGGLQSMEEAIFSHVPIVGIPYIADQASNVMKLASKGGGIFLDKDLLTTKTLKEALLEVINNPKYKENIMKIAELSRDQPMTGIEKAVWWIEYVIRHKGARHLRNPAIDIPLYQYYFLDIIAFVLAVLFVFFFLSRKLFVLCKNIIKQTFFSGSKKVKAQ